MRWLLLGVVAPSLISSPFDAYGLAQTVARFPIPIITGLGHHNDVSIVDLMAHTATKTPTKAAEFVVSRRQQNI